MARTDEQAGTDGAGYGEHGDVTLLEPWGQSGGAGHERYPFYYVLEGAALTAGTCWRPPLSLQVVKSKASLTAALMPDTQTSRINSPFSRLEPLGEDSVPHAGVRSGMMGNTS
ncbi:hypothetical protein D3C87_1333890 [compost metagenome]